MPPRVTVIIATYNWSSVLRYAVGSVLRQTMPDFELLVVGDGCTDDSEQVVASLGDPRVRWINLPSNSGHQSAPNNEGLRQALGELVAYLGHDDLWLPHHLESHMEKIGKSRATVSQSLTACVEPNGRIWPVIPLPERREWGPPSSTMHRRSVAEAVGGWRDYREIKLAPDADLLTRLRDRGGPFALVERLTAIKFPASRRKDVYRRRPCDEQAAWDARIATEPDLEASLLTQILMSSRAGDGSSYRDVLRQFVRDSASRLRRRWRNRSAFIARLARRNGGEIDAVRRFKGL